MDFYSNFQYISYGEDLINIFINLNDSMNFFRDIFVLYFSFLVSTNIWYPLFLSYVTICSRLQKWCSFMAITFISCLFLKAWHEYFFVCHYLCEKFIAFSICDIDFNNFIFWFLSSLSSLKFSIISLIFIFDCSFFLCLLDFITVWWEMYPFVTFFLFGVVFLYFYALRSSFHQLTVFSWNIIASVRSILTLDVCGDCKYTCCGTLFIISR